jgi:hypothetical protein
MTDAAATNPLATFQMHGCRAVVLPVEVAFEPQIRAIEESVERVPGFAFDLSKALVESVCRTVLADLGTSADPNWNTPKLLRETTDRLKLLPPGQAQVKEAREAIVKTMNGLLQSIQGLCELRNNFGMASHGRDVAAARLEQPQARLAAQAADTIASFLYRTHRNALAESPADRVYYDDHKEFNQWLDDEFDQIVIGAETLQPSKVLYHTAITAYKVALTDFLAAPPGSERNGES